MSEFAPTKWKMCDKHDWELFPGDVAEYVRESDMGGVNKYERCTKCRTWRFGQG